MCGIVGFSRSINGEIGKYKNRIKEGSKNLIHRGPDGSGFYENANVLFAHRRLSIFDVSENGSQPMCSSNGRLIIVFNGEIYNFIDLQSKYLSDHIFRSKSDTEVLLECFSKLGVEKTLLEVRGMFSFCLFDTLTNRTYLGRDVFGEKPLYYSVTSDGLFFSSDLMGLLPVIEDRVVDKGVLRGYLRHGYCHGTNSIFKGVLKVSPGCLIEYNGVDIKTTQLMSFDSMAVVTDESYDEKYERFRHSVINAVVERSAADVPVGVLLSGGVDSSVIASILASTAKIDTFNLAFNEKDFDESEIASRVSSFIGSNHNVMLFTAKDALDLVSYIPNVFSEPFADISLLPTLAISRFARKKVTVGLSGDGGDELLYGYNKYFQIDRILQIKNYLPQIISDIGLEFSDLLLGRKRSEFIKDIFSSDANLDFVFASYNRDLSDLIVDEEFDYAGAYNLDYSAVKYVNSRLKDLHQYLPDNILVKSDRCSMFSSLELRAPFLDIEVLKNAFSFNHEELYKHGIGKRPLRQLLSEYVPLEVYNVHKKRGFSIPIELWLRSELRELVDYQLSATKIDRDGIFNSRRVKYYYDQFYLRKQNYAQLLWSILVFNLWHDKFLVK
jgi:asparagine synthase (glutamine-hydrolysing)